MTYTPNDLCIQPTADGSITCFDQLTGELYHNRAGAFTEALENFVRPCGLTELIGIQDSIAILDVPFGLGYNSLVALQTILEARARNEVARAERLTILGIELDRSILDLIEQVLGYPGFACLNKYLANKQCDLVRAIREEKVFQIELGGLSVSLQVLQGDMLKLVPALAGENANYDCIFHDPFSANKMPQFWTIDLFSLYKQMLTREGKLSTYSSAKAVRGGLLQSGFHIYRSLAVGAKSGGTVASVVPIKEPLRDLEVLTDGEMHLLAGRSGVPYRDPKLNSTRIDILKRRLAEQNLNYPKKA